MKSFKDITIKITDIMALILLLFYIVFADELFRIQYFDKVLTSILVFMYLRLIRIEKSNSRRPFDAP